MAEDHSLDYAEADEAIRRITRPLDILRSGPTLGESSDGAQVIGELEAELAARKRRAKDGQ